MAYFEQRKSGWSVKFRVTEDGVEKQKRLSGFATKREALRAYNDYIQLHEDKEENRKNDIYFGNIYSEYFKYSKDNIKESTYINMMKNCDKNILPYFKTMRVSDMTPIVVTNWFNSLQLSFKTRKTILQYLKMILNFGDRVFDIDNPISKLAPIKDTSGTPKAEMQIWSPNELTQFLSVISDPIYHAFFKFLYLSGCRKGEALALTWNDVNGNTVHISKQISYQTNDEKGYKVTSLKTVSSDRYLSFPETMMNELYAIKNHDGLIFSVDGKKPLYTRTIDQRFESYIQKSGVKPIRIHDLRHSCASFLISQGLPITVVSKRLGHSSVTTTMNVYSHMLNTDEQRLVNALDKI